MKDRPRADMQIRPPALNTGWAQVQMAFSASDDGVQWRPFESTTEFGGEFAALASFDEKKWQRFEVRVATAKDSCEQAEVTVTAEIEAPAKTQDAGKCEDRGSVRRTHGLRDSDRQNDRPLVFTPVTEETFEPFGRLTPVAGADPSTSRAEFVVLSDRMTTPSDDADGVSDHPSHT